ncbi:hypothetical protein LDENG_00111350, partial [Lucifuga dentata]
KKVIHAFISSRLDYCNELYSGISKRNIHRLQIIQNAAAWLLTKSRRSDHITPVLAALYQLPVSFRIDCKILFLKPYIIRHLLMQPAFAIRAPKLWNSLLEDLRQAHSVSFFKTCLKTYLYCMAFP